MTEKTVWFIAVTEQKVADLPGTIEVNQKRHRRGGRQRREEPYVPHPIVGHQ